MKCYAVAILFMQEGQSPVLVSSVAHGQSQDDAISNAVKASATKLNITWTSLQSACSEIPPEILGHAVKV